MSELIDQLKEKVTLFPTTPGVYLMKRQSGKVIYVGKAKNLKARVRSYFTKSKDHSVKTVHLVAKIEEIEYILTKTEVEAFLLEASLIKKYRPKYNIRLKDDKSYPYIRCSYKDVYPRFYLQRKVKNDGSLYFGPYTSGGAVRDTIKFLNQTFLIRDCSDQFMKGRKRACMTHQIGRCSAPCVNLIEEIMYRKSVDQAVSFLKGKDKKVIKNLEADMKIAASEERFEAAAKLRDSVSAIKAIWQKQNVVSTKQDRDQDVVACFGDERGTLVEVMHIRGGRVIGRRNQFLAKLHMESIDEDPKEWLTSFLNQYYGDNIVPDEIILPFDLTQDIYKLLQEVFAERNQKRAHFVHALGREEKQLMELALKNAEKQFELQVNKRDDLLFHLETIQKKLKLASLPLRIECYDISNFQGDQSVASQVVFEEGEPKTDDYRRYKIKTVEGSNDFASMKEVLERRFKHTEYDDPQLIVVDGGKGQLKLALEALKEVGRGDIPIVGLAKARVKRSFKNEEVESTEERFFLPGRQNPVLFSKHNHALNILVSLRDEAHRFAITYHRSLRDKYSIQSILDSITGLGFRRKKRLLERFETIEAIASASEEEIASLPTFNKNLARRILNRLTSEEPTSE